MEWISVFNTAADTKNVQGNVNFITIVIEVKFAWILVSIFDDFNFAYFVVLLVLPTYFIRRLFISS